MNYMKVKLKKEQEQNKIFYLDTNFFIYLFSIEEEKGKEILKSLENCFLYTSCLTYDEFVWGIRKLINKEISLKAGEFFLNLDFINFISLDKSILIKSHTIMQHFNLKPRDALHFASMEKKSIKQIISDDSDFDKVKIIERISIAKFLSIINY